MDLWSRILSAPPKCVPLASKSAYPWRGTQNFINVRDLDNHAKQLVDPTMLYMRIRKTLQALSCKVYVLTVKLGPPSSVYMGLYGFIWDSQTP